MIAFILTMSCAVGLFGVMLAFYRAGYQDAKKKYDNGIIRYDLTKPEGAGER